MNTQKLKTQIKVDMKLTDKAKEDFLIFLKENRRCNEKSFSEFPAIFEDALIIEWLDSVDIIVTVSFLPISKSWFWCGFNFSEGYLSSRQQATQKAILKANEIYNNLNTKKNEK